MLQDFKHGTDGLGDLYLCAMESSDKPRGSDGFWHVEETFSFKTNNE